MAVKKKKEKQRYPLFEFVIKAELNANWVAEYRFHPKRQWRFDYAVPEHMIAIEIEGGIFADKRLGHSSGPAIKKDMEKYNMATLMGWRVFRYMPEQTAECMDDMKVLKRTIDGKKREKK